VNTSQVRATALIRQLRRRNPTGDLVLALADDLTKIQERWLRLSAFVWMCKGKTAQIIQQKMVELEQGGGAK